MEWPLGAQAGPPLGPSFSSASRADWDGEFDRGQGLSLGCSTEEDPARSLGRHPLGRGVASVVLLSLPPAPPLPQVAIIAGNFELAEVIKTHKDSDVGEFCPPRSH